MMRQLAVPESAAFKCLASGLSGRRAGGSLLVLTFHRVLAEPDVLLPDEPDAARFSAILTFLQSCFRVMPLVEAVDRLRSGALPARALCVTFDDGYSNNCDVARPILVARGVPATVFVAPGFIDGGRMFNDTIIEIVRRAPQAFDLRSEDLGAYALRDAPARRAAIQELIARLKYLDLPTRLERIQRVTSRLEAPLPNDLMMTSGQVQQLHRDGIEIGAHTMDHPILASVDDPTALRQIAESKEFLERLTGSTVRSFAYPNGVPEQDYARRHVRMVAKAGFDVAVSTAWGSASHQSDALQIPRVAAWDRSTWRYGLRLALAYRQRAYARA